MPYHAFMSYAHRDEEGEAAITALRLQLELSRSAHLGQTVTIFQDKAGLLVGQMGPASGVGIDLSATSSHFLSSVERRARRGR